MSHMEPTMKLHLDDSMKQWILKVQWNGFNFKVAVCIKNRFNFFFFFGFFCVEIRMLFQSKLVFTVEQQQQAFYSWSNIKSYLCANFHKYKQFLTFDKYGKISPRFFVCCHHRNVKMVDIGAQLWIYKYWY